MKNKQVEELVERVRLTDEELKSIRDIVRYGDPYASADREALIAQKTSEAQLNKFLNDPDLALIDRGGKLRFIIGVEKVEPTSDLAKGNVYCVIPLAEALEEE